MCKKREINNLYLNKQENCITSSQEEKKKRYKSLNDLYITHLKNLKKPLFKILRYL